MHQPWQAKKEFFDLYPLENITVAKHKLAPEGMPPIAFHATDEDSPYTSVADSDAKLARRAYYAATSGMDSQVGRLLAHLADQDLAVQNSTVVLLHGDHGWQLGTWPLLHPAGTCSPPPSPATLAVAPCRRPCPFRVPPPPCSVCFARQTCNCHRTGDAPSVGQPKCIRLAEQTSLCPCALDPLLTRARGTKASTPSGTR